MKKLLPHTLLLIAIAMLVCFGGGNAGEEEEELRFDDDDDDTPLSRPLYHSTDKQIEAAATHTRRGNDERPHGPKTKKIEKRINHSGDNNGARVDKTASKNIFAVTHHHRNEVIKSPGRLQLQVNAKRPLVSQQSAHHQPPLALLFGSLGASFAMAFSATGAAIGIAKAGVAASHLGLAEPTRMLRGMLPVVMAELISIYGLIVGVVISLSVADSDKYTLTSGFLHLGSGLCVGLCGLASGCAIGSIGEACCRAYQRTVHIFTAMVLMLVFAEAIGLYGLIGALVLHGQTKAKTQ